MSWQMQASNRWHAVHRCPVHSGRSPKFNYHEDRRYAFINCLDCPWFAWMLKP